MGFGNWWMGMDMVCVFEHGGIDMKYCFSLPRLVERLKRMALLEREDWLLGSSMTHFRVTLSIGSRYQCCIST